MKKILIFGAGSIGNHMTYACRKQKLDTYITDISSFALKRMKEKIYPKRYGFWDKNIKVVNFKDVFKIKQLFDLIIIGTPPKSHLELYYKCKKKLNFKKLLIEKPLTYKKDKNLKKFEKEKFNKKIFCGYNHSISESFIYFFSLLKKKKFKLKNIDVNWREDWSGILNAHFWLKSEFNSYLGQSKYGGGSLQEHSHGLQLMNLILKEYGVNLKSEKFYSKSLEVKNKNKTYDCYTSIYGISKKIFYNYQTDLLTSPQDKSVKVSNGKDQIHLIFNYKSNVDSVIFYRNKLKLIQKNFKKTRSSEFEKEIKSIISLKKETNNLLVKEAIDVMSIINKAI